VADLLVALIHAFRMPVFFIVAGFFAAMLVQRRGRSGLLKHRFRRTCRAFPGVLAAHRHRHDAAGDGVPEPGTCTATSASTWSLKPSSPTARRWSDGCTCGSCTCCGGSAWR
jgi:hypothetical protein